MAIVVVLAFLTSIIVIVNIVTSYKEHKSLSRQISMLAKRDKLK